MNLKISVDGEFLQAFAEEFRETVVKSPDAKIADLHVIQADPVEWLGLWCAMQDLAIEQFDQVIHKTIDDMEDLCLSQIEKYWEMMMPLLKT